MRPAGGDGRPRRAALLLVLLLALALRTASALASWSRVPVDDERAYDECAVSLLEGGGIATRRPFFVSPGGGAPTSLWGCLQPLYVAFGYALSGGARGAVYLLNAVVGLVAVYAAFRFGEVLVDESRHAAPDPRPGSRAARLRAGVVAGGLAAGNVYLVRYTGTLLSETLYTALLCTGLLALASWRTQGGSGRAASAGAALGGAALVRGTAFYFAPLALAWLVLERRHRPAGALARECLAFSAALLVTIAPWVVRNRLVHDRPVFLDTKAGFNLYSYLHPDFDPWRGTQVPLPPSIVEPGVSESRRNEILVLAAREHVLGHPLRVIEMMPAKLALLLSPFPGRLTDPGAALYKTLYVLPLEALALAGIVRTRLRTGAARLLALLIVYYLLVHSLMTAGPRFRTPLDPSFAAFAGAAIARPLRTSRNCADAGTERAG